MLVVLATNHLGLGGSETYLLTVAEQLDRLGHEPVVYTREPGAGAELARDRGISVVDPDSLPGGCDAVLAQDAGVSLELASAYPDASHVFVAHSDSFDLQSPPRLEGAVDVVVALNDRVLSRLRAMAIDAEIIRLRQPIDIERFRPLGPLRESPKTALLLSNNLVEDRIAMLEAACADSGLELSRLGGESAEDQSGDIRPALAEADIVVGYGRGVLEAMACGRAAYVYDRHGGDGWVTAESYAALEGDGFGGRGEVVTIDPKRLAEDLPSYVAAMGPVNHDLVVAHHRANAHVEQLVELFGRRSKGAADANAPLDEMARLVRLEWRARVEAQALAAESVRANASRHQAELEVTRSVETAIRNTARHYEGSLSWRLTRPVRALGSLLKRR
jgi:hypothetical protein